MESARAGTCFTSAPASCLLGAPLVRIGRILVGRHSATKPRDEHRIAAVSMRPQPDPGPRAVRSPELERLEIGPVPEDRVAGRVGFGPGKGAYAVDEATAPANDVGDTGHDRHLQSSERRELVLLRAPQ